MLRRILFSLLVLFFLPCESLYVHAAEIPFSFQPGPFGNGRMYFDCAYGEATNRCYFDSGSNYGILVRNEETEKLAATGTKNLGGLGGTKRSCATLPALPWQIGAWQSPDGVQTVRCEGKESSFGIAFFRSQPFRLDFQKGTVQTAALPAEINLEPLEELASGHILLPASAGTETITAQWDTGASLSAVDEAFVAEHPELFVFIHEIPAADSAGAPLVLKMYEMHGLRIAGINVPDSYVLAVNFSVLQKHFGARTRMILGMNQIALFRWYMDIPGRRWGVSLL